MSKFSGKCDLCDHIAGLGGWYDRDGNPVKFGQEGVGCYYSDELQDFNEFKRKTGGVMYQQHNIKEITEYNQEFVAEHCNNFEIVKHEDIIPDKRRKDGTRTVVSYTYKYWGKEYTAKQLKQKGGVYITTEIHFDELLDIIKYYPYLVSMSASNKDKSTIIITNESFVDEEFKKHLKYGYMSNMKNYYEKELAQHCLDVVKNYYLTDEKKIILS